MSPLNYLHYDVFTTQPLLGNQLAVFPDARGLTTEQMQAMAREINFAETTFVLPPERPDTDVRMRIFTPAVEMPMAGHPTVGSTFALAHVGVIPRGQKEFVFGLNVGPTRVDLEWEGDSLQFAWMTQARPTFGPPVADRAAMAEAVGLLEGDLAPGLPIQEVSCGVPYVLLPADHPDEEQGKWQRQQPPGTQEMQLAQTRRRGKVRGGHVRYEPRNGRLPRPGVAHGPGKMVGKAEEEPHAHWPVKEVGSWPVTDGLHRARW